MTNIEKKIDGWKKRVLDLGKKNRLINYNETKRSTVKIIKPELSALYSKLVRDEKPLVFPYNENNIEDEHGTETDNTTRKGDIETSCSVNELQKTLRNLREKSKTFIEEQGVNILYLSFGFIKWKESPDSEQTLTSPLVLVPVTLTTESIISPYVLSLHEDEIVINTTLNYKFENDFGIVLPQFDSNTDDIIEYLEKIQDIVNGLKWDVEQEASLSLLSFLKIDALAIIIFVNLIFMVFSIFILNSTKQVP